MRFADFPFSSCDTAEGDRVVTTGKAPTINWSVLIIILLLGCIFVLVVR